MGKAKKSKLICIKGHLYDELDDIKKAKGWSFSGVIERLLKIYHEQGYVNREVEATAGLQEEEIEKELTTDENHKDHSVQDATSEAHPETIEMKNGNKIVSTPTEQPAKAYEPHTQAEPKPEEKAEDDKGTDT